MARHKKTRKTRRRMRGGMFPFTRLDGTPWSAPAPAPQTLELPPKQIAKTVAPLVATTTGTPEEQAALVGAPPPSGEILGPTASTAAAVGGRRRRRTRKTRRKH